MAYDRDKIFNQAITAIRENNLFFVQDVIAFVPCHIDTFYNLFPIDSEESETIKAELDNNKTNEKIKLRSMFREGASVEKLALYKLICSDDERKALSMTHQDINASVNVLTVTGLPDAH